MVALMVILVWSVWRAAAQTHAGAIAIIDPPEGARFDPGANIRIEAVVSASPPRVKRVEFMLTGEVLAVVTNKPYVFVWTNAPLGAKELTAQADFEDGTSRTSAVVDFGVYPAGLTFGLNRVPVLEETRLFQVPLWQYCASLIYIFLAFYVSKFLDYLTRIWLKRRADRTRTDFDGLMLDLLKGPVKIVLFVAFLRIGLELFSWPVTAQKILGKVFTVILAVALTYMALKFIDLAMGIWRRRTHPDSDRSFEEQLFPIIRKTLKVFTVVVATLLTLDNIGVNITAALASLSIGGLAVGLAAQDTLANMFGAVAIFVDKPFRVGEDIKLDYAEGTVESIGLRSTRVRNADGFLVAIPNKTMGNAAITNESRRTMIRTEMNFGLTYDLPAERIAEAVKIVEQVYRGHKMTGSVLVGFNKFTPSALNVWVEHKWKGTDYTAYLVGMQEMNIALKQRFDAAGIGFAVPTQAVVVKREKNENCHQ